MLSQESKIKKLLKQIKIIHEKDNNVFGSAKITRELNKKSKTPINHKGVEHIMSKNSIKSKVSKKFRATTYSNQSFQ